MDALMIVGVSGFALLSAVTAVFISLAKHRRAWMWGALSLVFNLPGLMVLVVVPVHSVRAPIALPVPSTVSQTPARPIAV